MFAWLMIVLLAGFGGIVIGSALCEGRKTKKDLVGEHQIFKGSNL